jgi:hypothetical protein
MEMAEYQVDVSYRQADAVLTVRQEPRVSVVITPEQIGLEGLSYLHNVAKDLVRKVAGTDADVLVQTVIEGRVAQTSPLDVVSETAWEIYRLGGDLHLVQKAKPTALPDGARRVYRFEAADRVAAEAKLEAVSGMLLA